MCATKICSTIAPWRTLVQLHSGYGQERRLKLEEASVLRRLPPVAVHSRSTKGDKEKESCQREGKREERKEKKGKLTATNWFHQSTVPSGRVAAGRGSSGTLRRFRVGAKLKLKRAIGAGAFSGSKV